MKAYTIMRGRPIGRVPEIYLYKPELPEDIPNPWMPEIEEWGSVEEAFKAVFDYCSYKEYRDDIRIVSEPENVVSITKGR